MKLGETLNSYTVEHLNALVKTCQRALRDSGPQGTRKAFLVDYLAARLSSTATLETLWETLESLEKHALTHAYHNSGQLNRDAFRAQYGTLPSALRASRYGTYGLGYGREANPLNLFLYHDMLADETLKGLAPLIPEAERFKLEGLKDAPKTLTVHGEKLELWQANTELVGLHDLGMYLRLVEQGALSHSKVNRQLTSKSVRTLLEHLLEGDFIPHPAAPKLRDTIRPFGLDVFAQESGLLSRRTKSGLSALGQAFLYEQDPEVLLEAFETWTHQGSFDELTRIKALKGLGARGTRLSPANTRREAIIEALSWCPTGVWIDIQEFYRAVKIWHFDIEVEQGDYSNLYVGDKQYGSLNYLGSAYWDLTQGLTINALILEYLGSIGAIDVRFLPAEDAGLSVDYLDPYDGYYSLYDGLSYFRINPLGAFLLGQAAEYIPSQPLDAPLFTIDDELKLHLKSNATPTPQLKQQLAQVATPLSDTVHQLSTQQLLGTLEAGITVSLIRDFLTQRHDGPLPQAAVRWLEQIEANRGMFTKQDTALLVRVRTQELAEHMLSDPKLAPFLSTTRGRTLVVPSSKEKAFRERLKELGYLLAE